MEDVDELIPHPNSNGVLNLAHRALVLLDSVVWTMKRQLVCLNVSFNNIDYLPPELGNLLLLRELDVSCNNLQRLPREVGRCSRLRKLRANGNYLEDIPAELGQCVLLEVVQRSKIPLSIDLTDLILSENKLREQPETLAELKALRVLHLQNNNLKTLPHALGAVVTLKEPNCTGNVGLEIVPAAWYSDTAMILWVCRLHQVDKLSDPDHTNEVAQLESLNDALEAEAQRIEESKLRLRDDIAVLKGQRRALLKE